MQPVGTGEVDDDAAAGPPADERLRLQGLEARRVDLIPAGSMFLATASYLAVAKPVVAPIAG